MLRPNTHSVLTRRLRKSFWFTFVTFPFAGVASGLPRKRLVLLGGITNGNSVAPRHTTSKPWHAKWGPGPQNHSGMAPRGLSIHACAAKLNKKRFLEPFFFQFLRTGMGQTTICNAYTARSLPHQF